MKHIIFDFDGTLTEGKGNIWKNLYKTLGYSVEKGSKYKKDLVIKSMGFIIEYSINACMCSI